MKRSAPVSEPIERIFAQRLAAQLGATLEKVILFGSRAEGRAKSWSDYDLLVVLTRKERWKIDGIYDLVTEFLLTYGADISLKIYTADELATRTKLGSPFVRRIQERGVTLWNKTSES